MLDQLREGAAKGWWLEYSPEEADETLSDYLVWLYFGVEQYTDAGELKVRGCLSPSGVNAFTTFPESIYMAGIDGVVTRIDQRARSLKLKAEKSAAPAQAALPFHLPAAVAMDIDGTSLVATRQLTRAGFERAIEIRQLQIANDQRALREWRTALRQADQFWAANPDWTFGKCLDGLSKKM